MLPDWLKIELREKWERLSERLRLPIVRERINEYPTVIVSVAGASALLLLVIVIWQLVPDKPPPKVVVIEKEWYYDLNTGKLFTAEHGLTPPIQAPSGPMPDGTPAGVRACVMSYKSEPNESERFIAFLETTATPEMLAKWQSRRESGSPVQKWGKGKMIRRVDDKLWVPADSQLGLRLLREAYAPNKNGQHPIYCRPR